MPRKAKFNKKIDGLKKSSFKKNRRWQADQDYVEQLINEARHGATPELRLRAKEALYFLSQFNLEYYANGGLKDKDALHGKKLRKAIYDSMNAANRDASSINYLGMDELTDQHSSSPEDALIDYIDSKKSKL